MACYTNLVHELRNADGVGRRAATAQAKEGCGTSSGIGNVILVVRAVEVLAIPAAKALLVNVRAIYVRHRPSEETYVGKRILERMPPGQAALGSASVSIL